MQRISTTLAALLLALFFTGYSHTALAFSGNFQAPAAPPPAADTIKPQDAFRAKAPEPGPAPEIRLGDFDDFTLDNGLQVVVVENHKLPRVSYQLYVDVPPHLEGDHAGAQQVLGDMLRRATADKTKEEIDESIDFIGASLSTSGSGAYASTISKYKEEVIGLLAEVVLKARFPEEEFKKVKEETKAALAQQLTTPDAIAGRVTQAVTYGLNHPYGEQMTEESLANIDLEVVKSVYDTYFVPNRSYLVMVGDITPDEARELASTHFSDWERKEVAVPKFPTPQRPEGVKVSFVPRAGAVQSNVIISQPIELEPGTKEAIRANLLNIVLGSGFNGRLFANLREDKGYTYGAYSSTSDDRIVGNFRAYANVRNEVTDSAVTQFLYELEQIATKPMTEKELADAKMQIAGSFGRALESPQRIASFALNTARYKLDRDFYPNYLKVVENSSVNDISEVARDIIDPNRTHIIVVGDKAIADKLAQFATSGKVDYYDVNGVPVDMEEMDTPSDLSPEDVINGYFEAIGGKEAAMGLRNVSITMAGDVQGQTINQSVITTNDKRMSTQMSMMGMTMAEERYNQGKAMMMQQGQKMPLPDEAVTAMGQQAVIFQESEYLNALDKVSIEGSEMVDGNKAIVLAIETPAGTVREYYDAETMLKVQTVRQQGPQTVTQKYGDYQATEGVMFPHSFTLEGMAPFPIELQVTELTVNTELDPALFEIEE
ncbi:putative Zn-dependent peptidase [Lewinella aquimaris]|uniref:Putative Zn-dependent peptidase n=1 Tax=Neolewinella aquimaris TaxID=1835722 RepID=A0A840E1Y2_9BACT|nr:pitrilysin family protein [Neolewinella aquimaris]MBB4079231.1 putative Zn-dependent peptidase [Neolewinella aquimaris]